MSQASDWGPIDLAEFGPRAVRRSGSGLALYYALRLFLAIVLLGGFLLMSRDVGDLHELRVHGQTVQADVADTKESQGKNTSYFVTYTYPATDDTFKDSVDRLTYLQAVGMQHILVTYSTAHPNVHRVGLVDEQRESGAWYRWVFGTVFLGLVATAAIKWGDFQIGRERRLLTDGIAVPAVIESFSKGGSGKSSTYFCHFRYRSPKDGESRTATVSQTNPFNGLKVNQNLTALVSEDGKDAELWPRIKYVELVT